MNITCTFSCEKGIQYTLELPVVTSSKKCDNHLIGYTSHLWNGITHFYRLADGLSVIITTFSATEDVTFIKEAADNDLFIISYDFSSDAITSHIEKDGILLSKQTLLNSVTIFSNALDFKLFSTAGTKVTRLYILIDKQWIAERVSYISANEAEKIKTLFLQKKNFGLRRMSLQEAGIIRKLINYPFDTTPETIAYFDIKAAANELLSYQIKKALSAKESPTEVSIDRPEVVKLREIKSYIKSNIFRENPITINELASKFLLSESSLKRIFKKYSKTNYTDFYNGERLKKAYEIICVDKSGKIQEVAHKLGYRNASYFSKAFKETFNFYPSEIKTGRYLNNTINRQ